MKKDSFMSDKNIETVFIYEYSGLNSSSYSYRSYDLPSTDPQFKSLMPDTLTLDVWNDVANCHYVYTNPKSI